MHKKVIGGRTYFYTSFRDKEGKVKTKYLGTDPEEAVKKEQEFQKPSRSNYIIITLLIIFAFGGLALINTFTGEFFFVDGSPSIIQFELNETWNLSNGFVRVSQNETVIDLDLPELVQEDYILVNLDDYELETSDVYVDLIYSEAVVDSAHISYVKEEVVNETIELNETVENETVEEEVVEEVLTITEGATVNFDQTEEIDGKYNALAILSGDYNASVYFFGLNSLADVTEVELASSSYPSIKTAIIYSDASNFTEAEIVLGRYGYVENIVKCEEWNNGRCTGEWAEFNTDFYENSTSVWFNVTNFSAYAGWYNPSINASNTLQIDYIQIDRLKPLQNQSVVCENGSVSSDVSGLVYSWYVNGEIAVGENGSTLNASVFNEGNRVDCGVLAQNGSNLLAYWGFDNPIGGQSFELVNNLTMSIENSPTQVTHFNFSAIQYDGVDQYLSNATSMEKLIPRDELTVVGWIKPNNLGHTGGIICKEGDWAVRFKSAKVGFLSAFASTPFNERVLSTPSPSTNWYHFGAVYNGSDALIYIDGELHDQQSGFSGAINNSGGALNIGTCTLTSQYFNGSIDNIGVYNRSFSAAEIIDSYNNGVLKLSRRALKIETDQAQFNNGTKVKISSLLQAGNITLAEDGAGFYTRGNFTSQIIEALNNPSGDMLSWTVNNSAGQNVSFQVRSAEIGYNGSKIWSEFSGPDYTNVQDSYITFALDFGEDSGNITNDRSINVNNGVLNGTSRVHNGKHGSGVSFSGQDYITVSNDGSLMFNDTYNISMEVWVKPSAIKLQTLFNKQNEYILILDANGLPTFIFYPGGVTESLAATSAISTTDWSHVAITYDNTTARLYVNGVEVDSESASGAVGASSNDLYIGLRTFGNRQYFTGMMDTLAFYNRTLTAAEIKAHADDKFTNNSGEKIGKANRYVQYKAFFETNDSTGTPAVQDVTLSYTNYSTYVYNEPPSNVSLLAPSNASVINVTTEFNWTNSSDLESNASIFYEFIAATDLNFSNVTISKMAINNFSESAYTDDNYTALIEHFHSRSDMSDNSWTLNNFTIVSGMFGDGAKFIQNRQNAQRGIPSSMNKQGTIELWLKPEWSGAQGKACIFAVSGSIFKLFKNDDGALVFFANAASDAISYNVSNWSAGTWYHLALSWQENQNLSMIINGNTVNKTSIDSIGSLGNNLYLGTNAVGTFSANATIDEFKISNVSRVPFEEMRDNNVTVNPALYDDNMYYWKVRAVNYNNRNLEGENIYSAWSQVNSVRFDTKVPTLIEHTDLIYNVPGNGPYSYLNLTSSEEVYCMYKNSSMAWTGMNITNGVKNTQLVSPTAYNFYTYYIKCNDTQNKQVNETISFVIVYDITSYDNYTQEVNFTAGQSVELEFEDDNGGIFNITLTTRDNLTASVHVLKFGSGDLEASRDGIKSVWGSSRKMIIFDEQLRDNLSYSNISVFYGVPGTGNSSTIGLYQFNVSSSEYNLLENAVIMSSHIITINTTEGRTMVVTMDASASETTESAVGADAEEAAEEAWVECEFDSDCGDGYECVGGECLWDEEDHEDIGLIQPDDEEEIEEEAEGVINEIMQTAEDILGETGTDILVTGAYIGVGSAGVYYLGLLLLALLFFFKRKYKVGNVEIEGVKKVPKSKLEAYIFAKLEEGKAEKELVKLLVEKGWNEKEVADAVSEFRKI
tara:strand:- start:4590 stop:9614 length:5025 start_codon:yes stop_codon:yes gene_type:complete